MTPATRHSPSPLPIFLCSTWDIDAWADEADFYLITVAETVVSPQGNALDGDWVNPLVNPIDPPLPNPPDNSLVSEFPSGDGVAGGDFNFVVTILPGDLNQDGQVEGRDLGILLGNWMQTDQDYLSGELNNDNEINGLDLGILLGNYPNIFQVVTLLADINNDWVVDDDDVQFIEDTITGGTYVAAADLNNDGVVDVMDLDLAQAQLGMQITVVV